MLNIRLEQNNTIGNLTKGYVVQNLPTQILGQHNVFIIRH